MKYTDYAITIHTITPMLGSVPADPSVYEKFLAARVPSAARLAEEISDLEELSAARGDGVTYFRRHEGKLYLYDYVILGFIKEAGNVLKEQLHIKNLRSKIEWFVYVSPRRIYLPTPVEVLPIEYRAMPGMTMRGPRSIVLGSERLDPPVRFNFQVRLLDNNEIKEETLTQLLEYGQVRGLGQWYNGGWGRFEVDSLTAIE